MFVWRVLAQSPFCFCDKGEWVIIVQTNCSIITDRSCPSFCPFFFLYCFPNFSLDWICDFTANPKNRWLSMVRSVPELEWKLRGQSWHTLEHNCNQNWTRIDRTLDQQQWVSAFPKWLVRGNPPWLVGMLLNITVTRDRTRKEWQNLEPNQAWSGWFGARDEHWPTLAGHLPPRYLPEPLLSGMFFLYTMLLWCE